MDADVGDARYAPLGSRTTESLHPAAGQQDRTDSFSMHSLAPLNSHPNPLSSYPPPPSISPYPSSRESPVNTGPAQVQRPAHGPRGSSWDLLSGIRKLESDYEHFDPRNASTSHLKFADGDIPRSRFFRFYNWLLNVSIVTRWTLFIVPVLAILWIPGILGLTAFPDGAIWGTAFIWWSIWLSVVWGGWWAALAASLMLPSVLTWTVGVVAVGTRNYIQWLSLLHRYVAFAGWTVAIWVSFSPLVIKRQMKSITSGSQEAQSTIAKLLFGLVLCAGVLLAEKVGIQWVAQSFHERSYAERIAEQKQARKILVILYRNSTDTPGRDDTLRDNSQKRGAAVDPRRLLKKALKGFKGVAQTTTTAFGNVASEIAGSSILQPNSPQAMVAEALASANKSRLLARRLFYSYRATGASVVVLNDIAMLFNSNEEAATAFALFDKDDNGDATRDEFEAAILECHREQLSIANSMRDLDSAVGRLDKILMSLYSVIALLIMAVALVCGCIYEYIWNFHTQVGDAINYLDHWGWHTGFSWLIGGSLQEVLTSIIFIFVKHPYDVGDRIQIEKSMYTIKEIRLLSTMFLDGDGSLVQAPNVVLNSKYITNIRRSQQMSESFSWDVAFETSFDDIEALRAKMVAFVKSERRDFLPAFDIVVVDFEDQERMTLKSDIKYKSNCQQGALKAKRRNMWICALRTSMKELRIFGPAGDPDAKKPPKRITMIPYDHDGTGSKDSESPSAKMPEPIIPKADWQFTDHNAVVLDPTQDVYGEIEELYMTNPRPQAAAGTPGGADVRGRIPLRDGNPFSSTVRQ